MYLIFLLFFFFQIRHSLCMTLKFVFIPLIFYSIMYCLFREYFMCPIDETTVANSVVLSEYKMLQVRR